MESVPPRGSGWVRSIVKIGLTLRTHPLPRGGTDSIQDKGQKIKGLRPKSKDHPQVNFLQYSPAAPLLRSCTLPMTSFQRSTPNGFLQNQLHRGFRRGTLNLHSRWTLVFTAVVR